MSNGYDLGGLVQTFDELIGLAEGQEHSDMGSALVGFTRSPWRS